MSYVTDKINIRMDYIDYEISVWNKNEYRVYNKQYEL